MKEVIEYPTDAPIVNHPLYAFVKEHRIPRFVEALIKFYECDQADLAGKFEGDLYYVHRAAFEAAWWTMRRS